MLLISLYLSSFSSFSITTLCIYKLGLAVSRIVKEKDLRSQLTARTRKDIEATMDKKVKETIEREEDDMALAILQDFARTTSVTHFSDITDEVR